MTTGTDTGGFHVAPDALIRMRTVLGQVTEAHLRACDTECSYDQPRPVEGTHRIRTRAAPHQVPSWHDELDLGFQAHREALLRSHDDACGRLAAVVRSYLAGDAAVAALLDDRPSPAALDATQTHEPPEEGLVPVRLDRSAPITDLEHAATVWRRRRDLAADTTDTLDAALADLDWRGAAAEAFEQWAREHLRRWRDLSRAADTVTRALLEPRSPDGPDGAGPDIACLTTHPAPPLPDQGRLATHGPDEPIEPPRRPDEPDAHSTVTTAADPDANQTTTPDATTPAATITRTDDSPAAPVTGTEAPTATTDESDPAPATHHGSPTTEAPTPDPTANDAASTRAGQITSTLDPAPTNAPLAPDAPDTTPHGHVNADLDPGPPATTGEPPSAMPPMIPTAAAAGATAIARADRDHHIVREIPIPPSPPSPPGPNSPPGSHGPHGPDGPSTATPRGAPPGDTGGVLTPPERFRHPATDVAPPRPPGPTGRADPTASPGAASGVGLPDLAAAPAAASPPGRPRRDAGPAPMWVNLDPAGEHGAWIDLTARPGLGLHGPGAPAVARTVLRELHAHTRTVLILPAALLDDLTTDPTHTRADTDTDTRTTETFTSRHRISDRIHTVDDPWAGLRRLTAHFRDAHRARDEPSGLARSEIPAAALLVVPAPSSAETREDLARTLTDLHPAPAAGLLLGTWSHGAHLDLDTDHRVRAHHHPADTDLTDHRLHPTGADELAHELRPHTTTGPPEPDQDRPGDAATDTTGPADDDATPVDTDTGTDESGGSEPATPLTLCVLGPVELRHRAPAEPDATGPTAGVPTVVPIPRLARELLAYLAAHPAGATRDHLVEVLCPDSTARRPETNLHAALSRLRRSTGDTTADDSAADLIVTHSGRWVLNPRTVTVDYWTLLDTTTSRRDTPERRRRRLHAAVAAYRDLFAADLSATWAHSVRESARRRHLEIINELTEIEIRHGEFAAALGLLERAREIEPLNEDIYRTIMSIQLRDGRTADAHRTYRLLQTELAAIDVEPAPRTRRLLTTTTGRT